MANQRNHHFIPKFHLKYFANETEKKMINLLSKKKKSIKTNVSLRHQAQKRNLYGNDNSIEQAFAEAEGKVATSLRNILSRFEIGANKSIDRENVLFYFSNLILRNPIRVEQTRLVADSFLTDAYRENGYLKDNEYIKSNDLANMLGALKLQAKVYHLISDLKPLLIINQTNNEFVLADNPVSYYNEFLEEKRPDEFSNSSPSSIGIQIFLPITPKVGILLYDKNIYKCGVRSTDVIYLSNDKDIFGLNCIQVLNSKNVIYFRNIDEKYLGRLCDVLDKYPNINKMITKPGQTTLLADGSTSQIVVKYREDIKIRFKMSFLKKTKKAKRLVLTNHVAQIRNHALLIRDNYEK